jgi:hypothetical protein
MGNNNFKILICFCKTVDILIKNKKLLQEFLKIKWNLIDLI